MMFDPNRVRDWAYFLATNRQMGSTTQAAIGADVPNGTLLCSTQREVQRLAETMQTGKPRSFGDRPPLGYRGPVVVDAHVFGSLCQDYVNLHDSKEILQKSYDAEVLARRTVEAECGFSQLQVARLDSQLSGLQGRLYAMEQQVRVLLAQSKNEGGV